MFPASWIDLVVVLRTESAALYDRMQARGYKEAKVQENLDAEIMGVLLEEARGAYEEEMVVELRSDVADDVERNVERIEQWVEMWKRDNKEGGGAAAAKNGGATGAGEKEDD